MNYPGYRNLEILGPMLGIPGIGQARSAQGLAPDGAAPDSGGLPDGSSWTRPPAPPPPPPPSTSPTRREHQATEPQATEPCIAAVLMKNGTHKIAPCVGSPVRVALDLQNQATQDKIYWYRVVSKNTKTSRMASKVLRSRVLELALASKIAKLNKMVDTAWIAEQAKWAARPTTRVPSTRPLPGLPGGRIVPPPPPQQPIPGAGTQITVTPPEPEPQTPETPAPTLYPVGTLYYFEPKTNMYMVSLPIVSGLGCISHCMGLGQTGQLGADPVTNQPAIPVAEEPTAPAEKTTKDAVDAASGKKPVWKKGWFWLVIGGSALALGGTGMYFVRKRRSAAVAGW